MQFALFSSRWRYDFFFTPFLSAAIFFVHLFVVLFAADADVSVSVSVVVAVLYVCLFVCTHSL